MYNFFFSQYFVKFQNLLLVNACTVHAGSSRYASSYDYGGAGIELPPDMHESMMKYAREIVLQCAALDKAIEEV